MDYYGPRVPIGGGALSGKDLSHIDRAAAYAARQAAIHAVCGGARECRVTLAYAPNRDVPLEVTYDMESRGPRCAPVWFAHSAVRERYTTTALRRPSAAVESEGNLSFDTLRCVAPVVLHIPHGSTVVPADVRRTFLVSDEELRRELLRVTDWYTSELFQVPVDLATTVSFPVSRLVVDPERFADDEREVMAARGAGVIYTRTSDGSALRLALTSTEREALLRRFYEPHHCALAAAVDEALVRRGHALVIDCHSFPSRPLSWELDQSPERPDICLGTDAFHTPTWLRDLARQLFESAGFSVAIDRPFSGALVPAAYLCREPSVSALMVEVNRLLYMNEETGSRLPGFPFVAARVRKVLAGLIARLPCDPACHGRRRHCDPSRA